MRRTVLVVKSENLSFTLTVRPDSPLRRNRWPTFAARAASAPSTSSGLRTSVANVRSFETDFTGSLSWTSAHVEPPRAWPPDPTHDCRAPPSAVISSRAASSPSVLNAQAGQPLGGTRADAGHGANG